MSETGVVKFSCEHVPMELSEFDGLTDLNHYRTRLVELGLIGLEPNGIGFGNISIRSAQHAGQFYITGSGTGKLPNLTISNYSRVTAFDFKKNWLRCEGRVVASSESLTHAAVYDSDPNAMAVIHGHDLRLWTALLDKVPTTPKEIEYGTPEIACAVRRLFRTSDVANKQFFLMGGHRAGLIAFGTSLREAFDVLLGFRNRAG